MASYKITITAGRAGLPITVGTAGARGPQGPQGVAGPTGPTGPDGPQGDVGDDGPQGDPGVDGTEGDVGPPGPQGEAGPQGEQGEAGSTTFATSETPSGTMNGINTSFVLAHDCIDMILLTRNGLVMNPGIGNDYTVSGTTLSFLTGQIPLFGDSVLATYTY